jgi:hypothetical protein
MSADFVKTYVKEMAEKTEFYVEPTEDEKEVLPEDIVVDEDPKEVRRQHILTMVKCIALDDMNKNPLMNPKDMKDRDKKKLIELCQGYIDKINENDEYEIELKSKFAEVCNEHIYFEKYDEFPIYLAPHQSIRKVETLMDIAGNILEVNSDDK